MYKITRIFASDIVAGANILQQACFPIYEPDNEAPQQQPTTSQDHGVIFAGNGTCKTTLISFLLSTFCPEQNRFVQHIQSGGDKNMSQYLMPGRPALILLEMAVPSEHTLFGKEKEERMVIGQYFIAKRESSKSFHRFNFQANSPDLFDRIKENWQPLTANLQPDAAVMEFLEPLITIAGSQKEWSEKLEKIGLDPWLVNKQIDFAKSEGGIKDAFRFKAESDFLEFFLGCVTDMSYAEKLRQETLTCIGKIKDRPEKKSRLDAINTLKSHLKKFDQVAGQWRIVSKAQAKCSHDMETAAFRVAKALPQAQSQKDQAQKKLEKAQANQNKTKKLLQLTGADQLKAQEFNLTQDEETYNKKRIALSVSMERTKQGLNALRAADTLSKINTTKAEIQSKSRTLEESNTDLHPSRMEVDQRARDFHISLCQKYKTIEAKLLALKKEQDRITENRDNCDKATNSLSTQKEKLVQDIARLETRLESAKKSRQNIWGQNQIFPKEIKVLLEQTIFQTQKDFEQNRDKLNDVEAREKINLADLQTLMSRNAQAGINLDLAREKQAQEKMKRDALLSDPHLQRVIGTSNFDPTNAVHISGMADAVYRKEKDLGRLEKESRRVEEEQGRLEEMQTLAVGQETHNLIIYFRDKGLKKSEIRAYPEYLAAMDMDPNTRADFFHHDPARFTGILAMNQEILNRIKALEVPPWLKRPVVISLPCNRIEEVKTISHEIIAPPDSKIYTKQGADRLKKSLTQDKHRLKGKISDLRQTLDEMKTARDALIKYRTAYPDSSGVQQLATHVKSAEHLCKKSQEKINEQNSELEKTRGQIKHQQNLRVKLEGELSQNKEKLNQTDHWLDQYGESESWDAKIITSRHEEKILFEKLKEISDQKNDFEEKTIELTGEITARKEKHKHLGDLKSEVPPPDDFDPKTAVISNQKILNKDPYRLKKLYTKALRAKDKISTQLGIGELENEIERLKKYLIVKNNSLAQYESDTRFDYNKAQSYAAESDDERQKEKINLENQKTKEIGEIARTESDARHTKEKRKEISDKLKALGKKNIFPELKIQDLIDQPHEDMDLMLKTQKIGLEKELQTLQTQISHLRTNKESITGWYNGLNNLNAMTCEYAPEVEPSQSTEDWPNLIHPRHRIENCQTMKERIQALQAKKRQQEQEIKNIEKIRNQLFDSLKTNLMNEEFGQKIPTLVNELKSHDAESLGKNSQALMENCSDIAQILEGDLVRSKHIMATHIDMLLEHAKDCHQKINSAAKVTIPETVYIYGGNPILKASARLNFTRYQDAYKKSVENWIDELIQSGTCPQVNPNKGNCLGSDLLYRLLGVDNKKSFNIRLLKCDDTAQSYEPVGRDLGSGGEALTTSVLLYTLLVSMRKKRVKGDAQRMPAFLILDNPLGVCNRPDFLDAQLKVAHALGVQCIYLTGIKDTGSIELFPHRISILKGSRQLTIDGKVYDKLEIIQQHLEG